MCSVMTLRTKPGDLARNFRDLADPDCIDRHELDIRAQGFLKKDLVPVIYFDPQIGPVVRKKYFSLCPDWARKWPFEYETYNARLTRPRKVKSLETGRWEGLTDSAGIAVLETIAEVPSFRDSFAKGQTCLVPLTGAIESCYFGESAGKIVRFELQSEEILFAAGLWNDWFDARTGEFIPTFTLLTDAPDAFIFSHGHDRSLIAIDKIEFDCWLQKEMDSRSRLNFIRSKRVQPNWRAVPEREMKKGWNKRAPSAFEIAQIDVWRSDSII